MILALTLLLASSTSATEAPTPSPRIVLDAPDPRAPLSDSDFGAWEAPVTAPKKAAAPAAKPAGIPVNKVLGKQPVVRGSIPSGFGTLELQQATDVAETWIVKVDGGTV